MMRSKTKLLESLAAQFSEQTSREKLQLDPDEVEVESPLGTTLRSLYAELEEEEDLDLLTNKKIAEDEIDEEEEEKENAQT